MNTKPKLTSAEIGNLWNTYINDSITKCIMAHFKETVTNPDIPLYIDETIKIAEDHMQRIRLIFTEEKIAVPNGFPVEKHVVPNAPKLFSDIFYLEYIRHICKMGIGSHAAAITLSAREDIRLLFQQFLEEAVRLNNMVITFMEEIGVFIRTPNMTYPDKVSYVEKQGFLNGYLGRQRPLLAVEVTHLTTASIHNVIGMTTCLGFAQVTQDEEIRHYFLRGKRISSDILNHVHGVMSDSNVPNPMTWNADLTNTKTPPFSEQLMLFIMGSLSNVATALYGTAMSMTMRRDVGLLYADFIRKSMAFGEDGLNLQIERDWLEQPPQFDDHEKLTK